MRSTFFSLLFALALISCDSPDPQQIKTVQLLSQEVDEVEQSIQSWNLDSLKAENRRISDIVDRLRTLSEEEGKQLSLEEGNLVSDYKSATKAFRDLGKKVPIIETEIDYTKSQLSKLEEDLTKGVWNKEERAAHIISERQAVTELKKAIHDNELNFKRAADRVETLEPKIKELIQKREE